MQKYISKPKKAQEQDGFGNKMKYHFHITTVLNMLTFLINDTAKFNC